MSVGTILIIIAVSLLFVGLILIGCLLAIRRGGIVKRRTVRADELVSTLEHERLQSGIILESIDDGVVLIDESQTIRLFNEGAHKITGWTVDEAQGLSIDSVMRLLDNKGIEYKSSMSPFVRVFKEGKSIRDNTSTLALRSGKQMPISLSISPLMSERDKVTAAVAIFRDVSQERAEEQQRAEFISTASHEMRTPVAAIEGYLALALNDKVATVDSRARSYLEKAHASTQHLGKLFQDLLTSAKAEDGRLSSHPAVIEFGAWLEQLTQDLRFVAEKKGLFVDFSVGGSGSIDATQEGSKVIKPLFYVWADADRMREVITNLFDNAVKYTDKGHISIGLTGDSDVVQFSIKDTGAGIPKEDIPHLFQKFYRVDNSATRTIGGTGLGLFISRKITELYGGRIWVESDLDSGSTFFINLPRISTQKATELLAQAPEASQ